MRPPRVASPGVSERASNSVSSVVTLGWRSGHRSGQLRSPPSARTVAPSKIAAATQLASRPGARSRGMCRRGARQSPPAPSASPAAHAASAKHAGAKLSGAAPSMWFASGVGTRGSQACPHSITRRPLLISRSGSALFDEGRTLYGATTPSTKVKRSPARARRCHRSQSWHVCNVGSNPPAARTSGAFTRQA